MKPKSAVGLPWISGNLNFWSLVNGQKVDCDLVAIVADDSGRHSGRLFKVPGNHDIDIKQYERRASRWMAFSQLEVGKGFRRIAEHNDIGVLVKALERPSEPAAVPFTRTG